MASNERTTKKNQKPQLVSFTAPLFKRITKKCHYRNDTNVAMYINTFFFCTTLRTTIKLSSFFLFFFVGFRFVDVFGTVVFCYLGFFFSEGVVFYF